MINLEPHDSTQNTTNKISSKLFKEIFNDDSDFEPTPQQTKGTFILPCNTLFIIHICTHYQHTEQQHVHSDYFPILTLTSFLPRISTKYTYSGPRYINDTLWSHSRAPFR